MLSWASRGWTRLPSRLARATGSQAAAAWGTAPAFPWWEGLVILSRFPVVARRRYVLNVHRRYLEADLEVPGGRLTVGCLHISGWKRPWKEREMGRILELLPAERAVLAGDFNLRPHDPLMRQAFERLQWDYSRLATNSKAKIDYVLATRDLKLEGSRLLPKYSSDHNAVAVEVG